MSVWSKIRGTTEILFQLGRRGAQLKSNSGAVEHRNAGDSAFAITRGADPVGNDDLITLRYFNTNNASANQQTTVALPLLQATKVSTVAIPNGAEILECMLDVTTLYNGTAPTFKITRTGQPSLVLLDVGDADIEVVGTYKVPLALSWGATGAGTVTATLGGSATSLGNATLYVTYATPNDIS